MKNSFSAPKAEIIYFDEMDIICTSGEIPDVPKQTLSKEGAAIGSTEYQDLLK